MAVKCDIGLLLLLRLGVNMGHTNAKEGILSSSPEIPSLDVQTGSWVSNRRVKWGSCLTYGHTRFSR